MRVGALFAVVVGALAQHGAMRVEGAELVSRAEKERRKGNHSSFQCIGASQVLETHPMSWAMRQGTQLSKFPMNDAEFRTCKFRNVCLIKGKLTFYMSNHSSKHTPAEYLPEGFKGSMFYTGHLRGHTMPVQTVVGPVPQGDVPMHDLPTFLDAVSWSFNYGHYLIDNVLPVYIASRIFNLPFSSAQQLFETKCRQFTTLPAKFANEPVGYNRSLGSYSQACLARVEGMHAYFFNHAPLFVDELVAGRGVPAAGDVCFRTLVAGHGSTFGLKSVELARAVLVRDFRDLLLTRLVLPAAPQENLVLVGMRTPGAAGGKIINDLCTRVRDAVARLGEFYSTKYRVECFVPAEVSLEQEVAMVRRAKVLVSVHGTISYLSLFARDGTQQVSIADPKEYKENQILLYLSHVQMVYLTWDRIQGLQAVLHLALDRSEDFHEG